MIEIPKIELIDISKRFGRIKALDNINLSIKDKEYVVILGPSGCGKTTLMNVVSGIISPTTGKLLIDEEDVTEKPLEERKIGFVFQNMALFNRMTVEDNVSYPSRVKGENEADYGEHINDAMRIVEILEKKGLYPYELSSGEKQKTAIARAIASQTKLLILDEAFSALDPRVRIELRYEMLSLVKKLGLTVLHITHDQDEGLSMADRIVVMKKGEIIDVDSPENLYNQPNNIFTCFFVGEVNFFEGLVRTANSIELKLDNKVIKVNDELLKNKNHGDLVVVAIRPELFSIKLKDDTSLYESYFSGTVEYQTFMGQYWRIQVVLDIEEENEIIDLSKERIQADILTGEKFTPGKRVELYFDPNHLLVYGFPKGGIEAELKLE